MLRGLFVMAKTRMDNEDIVGDRKDKPVLFVDSNAPHSGEVSDERLGFANAVKAVAFNAFEKCVYPFKRLFVSRLPFGVFVPGSVGPQLFHFLGLLTRVEVLRWRTAFFGWVFKSSISIKS